MKVAAGEGKGTLIQLQILIVLHQMEVEAGKRAHIVFHAAKIFLENCSNIMFENVVSKRQFEEMQKFLQQMVQQ